MFSVLATSASTDCAAGGGLHDVGMLLLLLAVVGAFLVIWAGSHRPEERRQPPQFLPVQSQAPELFPTEQVTPPDAPVTVDIEIDRVIVDRPSDQATPRRPTN